MPLSELVGFDYAGALRDLASRYDYAMIAERIGYESKGSITKIINGSIPSHVHGEALWALYVDTFGRKPPLTRSVSSGAPQGPKTGV